MLEETLTIHHFKPKINMKILAIDPATKTGWACNDPRAHGVWDLSVKSDESDGMRLIRFQSKLTNFGLTSKVNLITFERPGGQFKKPIMTQSELIGVIKTFCITHGIEYRAYSSTEIKRHATGKGNCNKQAMIEAAREQLGYTGNDDNEADALWLLHLTEQDYGDQSGHCDEGQRGDNKDTQAPVYRTI